MKYLYCLILYTTCITSSAFSQSNSALSFNGTNQYVIVNYTDTLAPLNSVTVEAWIYANTLSGGPSIISKTEVGGYALYAASPFIRFDVRLNGAYRTVSYDYSLMLNSWHHIAATTDGRFTRLYIDGEHVSTYDVGNQYSIQYQYNNALIIGAESSNANNTSGSNFHGSIDEVRIWNVARTFSEINSTMNTTLVGNESGLIGYWNFDEGSGTIVNDLTQYGQNGTLVNSPTWISSGVSLPVELVSFLASTKQSSIELKWKTATEVDNYGFEIEKSVISNQLSAIKWSKAGFVEGSGTSNTPKEYLFIDNNLSDGKYSYRLKQIDRDGKSKYLQTVEVEIFSTPDKFVLEQNYPNPFNPSTTINYQISLPSYVTLKIYDVLGKEVATVVNERKEAGNYSVSFNASKLSGGIYFSRLQSDEKVQLKRMMLLK